MDFRRTLQLGPEASSPRLARDAVRTWLESCDLEELADAVLLITSELVTNAVLHVQSDLEVEFSAKGGAVRLAVRDEDPRVSDAIAASRPSLIGSTQASSGRGLALVEDLADEWGVIGLPKGKEIWAVVSRSSATSSQSSSEEVV